MTSRIAQALFLSCFALCVASIPSGVQAADCDRDVAECDDGGIAGRNAFLWTALGPRYQRFQTHLHLPDRIIFEHDPTVEPTSLEVEGLHVEDGSTGPIELDPLRWRSRGSGRGHHYIDHAGSRGGVTEIQHFGRGHFVIKARGTNWPWSPADAVDGLLVRFTTGDEAFCALFAEETARLIQNRPGVFSASQAVPPEGGCDALDPATLITGARVFDGKDIHDGLEVLVQGDAIVDVGPDLATPPRTTFIDGQGKTLLPGLIDSHTHNTSVRQLRQALGFGVTTHMGMTEGSRLLRNHHRPSRPPIDRADFFSSITQVAADPDPARPGQLFGNIDDPGALVDSLFFRGADLIKIRIDDQSICSDKPLQSVLSNQQIRDAIDAAHRRNLVAVTHVHKAEDARLVFSNGGDGIAHVFNDEVAEEPLIQLISAQDGFVVTTLRVRQLTGLPSPPPPGSRPCDFVNALENVRLLNQGGVSILAGTDTPAPGLGIEPGLGFHRELELLVLAGMSPIEALRSATSLPARHWRLEDRGVIEPGRLADLVLMNGDPTEDIGATRDIDAIWRRGNPIDRRALIEQCCPNLLPFL